MHHSYVLADAPACTAPAWPGSKPPDEPMPQLRVLSGYGGQLATESYAAATSRPMHRPASSPALEQNWGTTSAVRALLRHPTALADLDPTRTASAAQANPHNAAVPCLARSRCDIILATVTTTTPYHHLNPGPTHPTSGSRQNYRHIPWSEPFVPRHLRIRAAPRHSQPDQPNLNAPRPLLPSTTRSPSRPLLGFCDPLEALTSLRAHSLERPSLTYPIPHKRS